MSTIPTARIPVRTIALLLSEQQGLSLEAAQALALSAHGRHSGYAADRAEFNEAVAEARALNAATAEGTPAPMPTVRRMGTRELSHKIARELKLPLDLAQQEAERAAREGTVADAFDASDVAPPAPARAAADDAPPVRRMSVRERSLQLAVERQVPLDLAQQLAIAEAEGR